MKAKNISYPHPVLGNEDDVKGEFAVTFKHALGREEILLKANFILKNPTLEKMMNDRKAVFTVEVECPSTFFRKTFSTFNNKDKFVLPAGSVRENVNVGFYVRATAPAPKYRIKGCHSDYEGFTFSIGAGDVLAIGGFTSFIADKDFDPMRPAISSLMAIKQGADKEGPMDADYSQDKIYIRLSKKDYENYTAVKGQAEIAGVLHSSIVLPVLADAARLVGSGDEETQHTHWFGRLQAILRQQKLEDEDPLTAAQVILSNPVERCLSGLADNDDD